MVTKTKLQEFNDLGDFYAGEGPVSHIWKKGTLAYLDDFQRNAGITTTQSLHEMSTAGDSQDARDSHGVRYISSGNW